MGHILIVDDNPPILDYIADILTKSGHTTVACADGGEALAVFMRQEFDLVISDLFLPVLDGFELLAKIRTHDAEMPVIIITGQGGVDDAVKAIKNGASDFISKPFQPLEFRLKVERNLEHAALKKELARIKEQGAVLSGGVSMVGESPVMKKLITRVKRVSRANATVLILGESGTGKELLARAVHEESERNSKPFVPIDCSTLTETIIESELFGHVRGAFTGADRAKKGLLEEANGGTVFLDEIGNLSPTIQAKLLRFLQEREVKPVGSSRSVRVDVRIICATNVNLKEEMRRGAFREDLYYRLAGIELVIPPLRERLEDLPFLIGHFIRKYAGDLNKKVNFIEEQALEILRNREWKGNIRELEHLIEYALIVENSDRITTGTILHILPEKSEGVAAEDFDPDLEATMARLEAAHIRSVISMAGNNRSKAAKLLGISRSVLYEKLRRHGIG
ncbi:MAG TPA: sigma-54 dependent transcriptional regulator [Spirochaetota bacterium]|nr:sigma-54 dependent transcriptional regulator [Spirochaetota bacterium]HNT10217.1 sigma-54 dependent transcriptional regulator [Spirochaetota bacterium]